MGEARGRVVGGEGKGEEQIAWESQGWPGTEASEGSQGGARLAQGGRPGCSHEGQPVVRFMSLQMAWVLTARSPSSSWSNRGSLQRRTARQGSRMIFSFCFKVWLPSLGTREHQLSYTASPSHPAGQVRKQVGWATPLEPQFPPSAPGPIPLVSIRAVWGSLLIQRHSPVPSQWPTRPHP